MMGPGYHLLSKAEVGDEVTLAHQDFQNPRTSHLSQDFTFQHHFPSHQMNKYVFDEALPSLHTIEDPYQLSSSTILSSAEMEWPELPLSDFSYPSMAIYNYSSSNNSHPDAYSISFENSTLFSSAPVWHASNVMDDFAMDEMRVEYSSKQPCANVVMKSPGLDHFTLDGSRDFSHLSISRSPTLDYSPPSPMDALSCKASDDGDEEDTIPNQKTGEGRVSDEPYAKLIYRALLEAPNHSMVLQEIYQWFIDNTEKGNSSNSGWRNSIRHNLSMNAAFRKTDRQSSGDDTKKTSEWVLEPFAIKNGVTPTTRYRKNGKKAVKSESPMQSRQISGRKGGMCTKNTSFRLKGKDKPDISAVTLGIDTSRRAAGRHRRSMQRERRHVSPTTPLPVSDATEQYTVKTAPYEDIIESTAYSLDDVNGIYSESGPIFCSEGNIRYNDSHQFMWHDYSGR